MIWLILLSFIWLMLYIFGIYEYVKYIMGRFKKFTLTNLLFVFPILFIFLPIFMLIFLVEHADDLVIYRKSNDY